MMSLLLNAFSPCPVPPLLALQVPPSSITVSTTGTVRPILSQRLSLVNACGMLACMQVVDAFPLQEPQLLPFPLACGDVSAHSMCTFNAERPSKTGAHGLDSVGLLSILSVCLSPITLPAPITLPVSAGIPNLLVA